MENAADALKIAASVLIFVLALSISINAFSQARVASQTVLEYSDREYDYTYVATSGGPGHATESIAYYIYNYLFPYNKVGYGQTVAVIYLVICVIISNLVTRALRKREIEL